MSLNKRSLSRVAQQVPVGSTGGASQAQQVGLLVYGTDDAAATVEAGGYFNNARAVLRKGDILLATMVNSGTPVTKQYVFTAVPATGNVTIAIQATSAG
ncbi:hypothetical protein [Bosea sp. (in: a-proteobacteria)]|uniref:hypothetical protein n=1 Tax=Bosea sp. (in: a-proteobacteria) TaxID=1871050 RepID=UPI002619E36F|nr:hypothetical protein [Bosea sp. (in: a-proteobacteria)]MCO5091993.1 hypothetical protein [Bosea sp. (in: a-proteobacteria)]